MQTSTSPQLTKVETHHPELVEAVAEAKKFILENRSGSPRRWLSLLGGSGVGKTLISKNIHHSVQNSAFFKWMTIEDYMRKGDYGIIDHVCRVNFLVLDDIGAGYDTKLSKAKLLEIMERRLGKPTVITSNLLHRQIGDTLDVRISSRMLRGDSTVVELKTCPDYATYKLTQK